MRKEDGHALIVITGMRETYGRVIAVERLDNNILSCFQAYAIARSVFQIFSPGNCADDCSVAI